MSMILLWFALSCCAGCLYAAINIHGRNREARNDRHRD